MQMFKAVDPATAAHGILFRAPGEGPFPPAIVAHPWSQNVLRRAQMPQPEVSAPAAWPVARGFAALVPERPGHGATGPPRAASPIAAQQR
jgi:hypothetical protein